jgi:hypothetical protein
MRWSLFIGEKPGRQPVGSSQGYPTPPDRLVIHHSRFQLPNPILSGCPGFFWTMQSQHGFVKSRQLSLSFSQ